MSKKYYIYKITNNLSGKVYIGQSVQPKVRWRTHKYLAKNQKTNQYVHKAMHKYGVDNFTFEIIGEYDSKELVNTAECGLINQYKARDKEFGYNLKPGGYKRGGWKHSEETKAKQKARWHKVHTPESIEKTAEANRGKKLSEEHVDAIRQANLGNKRLVGRKQSQEHIDKREATTLENYGSKVCNVSGCKRTDGSKVNGIRYCGKHEQRLRSTGTLELKERGPAWNKGIPISEETRRKLSAALKGREVHNRIEFTPNQIKLIMSYTVSAESLADKYGVSRNVIKRVRRENRVPTN